MKNKNEYDFFSGKNLALLRQILKKMMSSALTDKDDEDYCVCVLL